MGGVHEVEFGVLREIDRVVVDDPGYALLRGDFASWIDRGEIARDALERRIDADIGEIVYGRKPGRTSEGQRFLAVIQGMAICDLIVAQFLLARADVEDVGQTLAVFPQMTVPEHARLTTTSNMIAGGLDRRRPRTE